MKRSAKSTGSAFGGFRGFGASSSSPTLSYITPPPDLSGVPQNIVVPFKNLLKKDSTTKAKALDEIVGYVREQNNGEELEEAILEAWVRTHSQRSKITQLTPYHRLSCMPESRSTIPAESANFPTSSCSS